MKNKVILFFCLILIMSSCSLVKNQKSGNFARVKYNSHLKFGNQEAKKLPRTAASFIKEETVEEEDVNNVMGSFLVKLPSKQLKEKQNEISVIPQKLEKAPQMEKLLKAMNELEIKPTKEQPWARATKSARLDEWWNDDIEDWPWLEIALAVIAVLVIGIIVTWLVGLVGGIISALIGLILLIALAYILYTLWIQ